MAASACAWCTWTRVTSIFCICICICIGRDAHGQRDVARGSDRPVLPATHDIAATRFGVDLGRGHAFAPRHRLRVRGCARGCARVGVPRVGEQRWRKRVVVGVPHHAKKSLFGFGAVAICVDCSGSALSVGFRCAHPRRHRPVDAVERALQRTTSCRTWGLSYVPA